MESSGFVFLPVVKVEGGEPLSGETVGAPAIRAPSTARGGTPPPLRMGGY